jgi:hypothetical protein
MGKAHHRAKGDRLGNISKRTGSEMDNYLNRVDVAHWRAA